MKGKKSNPRDIVGGSLTYVVKSTPNPCMSQITRVISTEQDRREEACSCRVIEANGIMSWYELIVSGWDLDWETEAELDLISWNLVTRVLDHTQDDKQR